VIASTLPVFLPEGIHHLEAWNEAVCDGRWGRAVARLSERLRRGVDLEHWAAFNPSFERLCDWLRVVATGAADAPPPASIVLVGGDVHNAYLAEVELGTQGSASRVFQIVCSPFRNPLSKKEQRIVRLTGSRVSATVFSLLARLAGVPSPSASWRIIRERTFDNSVGELVLDGRAAQVTIRRSPHEGEDPEHLITLHHTELAAGEVQVEDSRSREEDLHDTRA
jgi:hypothetical protein